MIKLINAENLDSKRGKQNKDTKTLNNAVNGQQKMNVKM